MNHRHRRRRRRRRRRAECACKRVHAVCIRFICIQKRSSTSGENMLSLCVFVAGFLGPARRHRVVPSPLVVCACMLLLLLLLLFISCMCMCVCVLSTHTQHAHSHWSSVHHKFQTMCAYAIFSVLLFSFFFVLPLFFYLCIHIRKVVAECGSNEL